MISIKDNVIVSPRLTSIFMKLINGYCILLAICFASSANAQIATDTVKVNSLNQLINRAVQHNPTQAIYQEQIKQAVYNYKASKGFIYPNVSAGFTGTDNLSLAVTPVPGELIGKPNSTIDLQFGKHYVYNTGITVNQTIFDWTNILQTKIADNNIILNRVEQDSYVQSLKEQVARYYFTALIARSALNIIAKDELLGDSVVALTKQRLQAGSTDLISVNQAVINFNSILQNKGQSQQLYDQSIENLKILLGELPASELVLTGQLNLDSLTATYLPQLGADKGLEVYKQQATLADYQARSQRSAAYPKIAATAYFGDQQYRNDFGLSLSSNAWSAYNYIGLSINVPIFTGFCNANKYKSSLAQKNIAQLQYSNAAQQSAINDRLLVKNYTDYLQMVKVSEASFKLYGDNLKLDQQKYKEGIISLDVYQKAFQDYLTAENTYLNNQSLLLSTQSTIISRQ
jgi:outer membrane protein